VVTQQVGVAGARPGSGMRPRRSTNIDKARPKTPLPKLVQREVEKVTGRALAAASVVVRRRPWSPGDLVTVDYKDGVAPYVGTVDSVGARGEVLVAFDDGSSAALKMKVRMPSPNTRSHTRSVLVSTTSAAVWCRRPVRVTLRYMYHSILKIGTFIGTCLLTIGSHHTN
jgi:hypothetical protein